MNNSKDKRRRPVRRKKEKGKKSSSFPANRVQKKTPFQKKTPRKERGIGGDGPRFFPEKN